MHYADYKTILSPKNGMNLYRGCTHGCIYCDSRSVCYQIKHGFEDIEVKRGADRILEAQLRARRSPCMIATGSMCDPYIPLEEELELTRRCLEVIERCGFGLSILTKSARILRDIDLLCAINERAKCVAMMTLTTFDEALCRVLEPGVSTTEERVSALIELGNAGIPTVVWISPILPFINDTQENLLGLLDRCALAGVRGIICFGFGTTMREGSREYFYAKLDEFFPGMKERYIRSFGSAYSCESPASARLTEIFRAECEKRGLEHRQTRVFDYIRAFETNWAQLTMFD
ncbi:MAG: radical SAM protein [Oscillospiraceae bacterium]|nr:radical SAM protein [Oscillospiraceae bacterium]